MVDWPNFVLRYNRYRENSLPAARRQVEDGPTYSLAVILAVHVANQVMYDIVPSVENQRATIRPADAGKRNPNATRATPTQEFYAIQCL